MLETYCRKHFQYWCIDKLAVRVALHWHPVTITIVGLVWGVLAGVAAGLALNVLAIILLLASGYCDMLDGTIARIRNQSTDIGSVLDIMSDRVVEVSMVIGLCAINPAMRGFYGALMLSSMFLCVTAFLVVGIFVKNTGKKGFFYSVGLVERAEAFGFFIAMLIWPQWFVELATAYVVLVSLTAVLHVVGFCKTHLKAV